MTLCALRTIHHTCLGFLLPVWGSLILKSTVCFSTCIWRVFFQSSQVEIEIGATKSHCLSLISVWGISPHNAAFDSWKSSAMTMLNMYSVFSLQKHFYMLTHWLLPATLWDAVAPLFIKNQKLREGKWIGLRYMLNSGQAGEEGRSLG